MSEKYTDPTSKLCEVLFHSGYFTEEEADVLEKRGRANLEKVEDRVLDNMDRAMALCNYYGDSVATESGIVQSVIGYAVQTAFPGDKKPWFMQRDENKLETLYDTFINNYMINMFGQETLDNGHTFNSICNKKVLSGNYEDLLKDMQRCGATNEEVIDFEVILSNSVYDGAYVAKDVKRFGEIYRKVAENRKKLAGEHIKTASELWEESAYGNPEFEPKKKTL